MTVRQRSALKDPVGYPDFTLPVSIIAQIIETLKVDIVAQTLEELKVDIAAQTISNVTIEIAAQTVSVKLVPDWGAVEAEDVDIYASATVPSGSLTTLGTWTVPTGKTVLIYDFSVAMQDGDGEVYGDLLNQTDGTYIINVGGERGFLSPLTKPKVVPAGKTIAIRVRQDTGASRFIIAHFAGVTM